MHGQSAAKNGVSGITGSSASGVFGWNNGSGYGVTGRAGAGGVAVFADSNDGGDGTTTALLTTGKLESRTAAASRQWPQATRPSR